MNNRKAIKLQHHSSYPSPSPSPSPLHSQPIFFENNLDPQSQIPITYTINLPTFHPSWHTLRNFTPQVPRYRNATSTRTSTWKTIWFIHFLPALPLPSPPSHLPSSSPSLTPSRNRRHQKPRTRRATSPKRRVARHDRGRRRSPQRRTPLYITFRISIWISISISISISIFPAPNPALETQKPNQETARNQWNKIRQIKLSYRRTPRRITCHDHRGTPTLTNTVRDRSRCCDARETRDEKDRRRCWLHFSLQKGGLFCSIL